MASLVVVTNHDDFAPSGASDKAALADRLDSLAETSELMGDSHGAQRLRERAHILRLGAMDDLP